jgi:protein TonB
MKMLRSPFVLLLSLIVASSPAQTPTPSTGSTPQDSGGRSAKTNPGVGTSNPTCYYMPNPPYTKEARKAKFEGVVLVSAIVATDGTLTDVKIVKSQGLGLDEQILKTMKKWKCKSATNVNGEHVPTKVQFEVNFRLTH